MGSRYDGLIGPPGGNMSDKQEVRALLAQVSQLCTVYMEAGGDPGLLADGLREQADTLCGQGKVTPEAVAHFGVVLTGPDALVRAKELVARGDHLLVRVTDERGYLYEVRRYADGVVCRRTSPLKVGDRVRYTQYGGATVEGWVTHVTLMPPITEREGELAYRLHLSAENKAKVGHPVTIPHSRVELIWPEKAIEATAFVSLHDGKRLGWKIVRGDLQVWFSYARYCGVGEQRPPRGEVEIQRRTFDNWEEAEVWCASFPAHPAEGGSPPKVSPTYYPGQIWPSQHNPVAPEGEAPEGEAP